MRPIFYVRRGHFYGKNRGYSPNFRARFIDNSNKRNYNKSNMDNHTLKKGAFAIFFGIKDRIAGKTNADKTECKKTI